jgi:6-pyruvoyltetrahydropterin/6-carboxytetrahydropterin synthase
MSFFSTKTYDHNEGLSCVFRQWKADGTHCKMLHGYALSFSFVFGCTELDNRNWCMNFGGMKEIKEWLKYMFDHTLCVAEDDPELAIFKMLGEKNLVKLRIVPAVGCEKTAEFVFNHVENWLEQFGDRVWIESVEVKEHAGNSAKYVRDVPEPTFVMGSMNPFEDIFSHLGDILSHPPKSQH